MVDEDDDIPNTTKLGTILRLRSIDQIRVSQLANERRDLRPHAVLLSERLVRISFEDKAFEQRPIQIISFALFNRQPIVVDFGAELPKERKCQCAPSIRPYDQIIGLLMITYQNQLFSVFSHCRQDMALEYFARLFH